MKKVLAIAFFGVLVFSCSKKPDHSLQDSNVMLQEPTSKVIDSAALTATVDQGNETVTATDATVAASPVASADSATTK